MTALWFQKSNIYLIITCNFYILYLFSASSIQQMLPLFSEGNSVIIYIKHGLTNVKFESYMTHKNSNYNIIIVYPLTFNG